MTDLIIRDATEADLPAIRDIYNHAVEHTTAIWNEVLIDVDNRRAWLEARDYRVVDMQVADVERDLDGELARLETGLQQGR